MRKSRSKNFLCKISVYLFILWIIISVIKKTVNHDGIHRYNFIQRNTLGYWIWILLGLCLSKYFFKRYLYAPLFIFAILIVHEFIFYELSKIPLVMNTSFNGPGEPIIETPEQAIKFLLNTDLDLLYIDGYRVQKKI